MSSPIRTALVGIGVLAICVAMASLKGHQLLMAFAIASIFGAVWSWIENSRQKPLTDKKPEPSAQPVQRKRTHGSNGATVYQFPIQQYNDSVVSS